MKIKNHLFIEYFCFFLIICVVFFSFNFTPLIVFASSNEFDYGTEDPNPVDQTNFEEFCGIIFSSAGIVLNEIDTPITNVFAYYAEYSAKKYLSQAQYDYIMELYGPEDNYKSFLREYFDEMLAQDLLIYNESKQCYEMTEQFYNDIREFITESRVPDYCIVPTIPIEASNFIPKHRNYLQNWLEEAPKNSVLWVSYHNVNGGGLVHHGEPVSTSNNVILLGPLNQSNSEMDEFMRLLSQNGRRYSELARDLIVLDCNQPRYIHPAFYSVSDGNLDPTFEQYYIWNYYAEAPTPYGRLPWNAQNNTLFNMNGGLNPRTVTWLYSVDQINIPVFYNWKSYYDFSHGNAAVYQYDTGYTGGNITLDSNLDYNELRDSIIEAIKSSGLNDSVEIQNLINDIARKYLEDIKVYSEETSRNTANMYLKLKDILGVLTDFRSDSNSNFNRLISKLDSINFTCPHGSGGGGDSTSISISNNYLFDSDIDFGDNNFSTDFNLKIDNLIDISIEQVNDISVGLNDLIGANSNRFPFSIPADTLFVFEMLAADPEPPVFELPLKLPLIADQVIQVDLSGWSALSRMSRAFFGLLFIVGLVPLTFKLLEWNERMLN